MPIQNNHLMTYVKNILVYSVNHDQAAKQRSLQIQSFQFHQFKKKKF